MARDGTGVTAFAVGVIATMALADGGVTLGSIPSSSTAKFTGCVAKLGGALRASTPSPARSARAPRRRSLGRRAGRTVVRGRPARPTSPETWSPRAGPSYVAKSKSTGVSPASDASKWGLLAAAGAHRATA